MAIAKSQSFEIITINRQSIKNAPYNPRVISKDAEKRLKKGLKKFGLTTTLTWNKRTGNLVSGHQRLRIMDELEGTQDYELTVSAVDVDEAEEMAMNVQMNNQSMMGEFDLDKLNEMLDFGADVNEMGFSESEIELMFGGSELVERLTDVKDVKENKEMLAQMKDDKKRYRAKFEELNDANYYFTVICKDGEERKRLFKLFGVSPSEEYIDVEVLRRINGKDW